MQGAIFQDDFLIFPIGKNDVVLGVKWLCPLDDINFNFKKLIMEFEYKANLLTLQGIQPKFKTVDAKSVDKMSVIHSQLFIVKVSSVESEQTLEEPKSEEEPLPNVHFFIMVSEPGPPSSLFPMLGPPSYIVHALDIQAWACGGVGVPHRWVKESLVSLYGLGQSSPHELAFEVMYDATGVRLHAGRQAEVLNQIVCELPAEHPLADSIPLRELLGHTPPQKLKDWNFTESFVAPGMQVVAGGFLGMVTATIVWLITCSGYGA
ncbi:hypothetical protein BC332_28250 [Capsicum chinense]|nr:hypothetical protein BC332_28250 [Capsicum chinense]